MADKMSMSLDEIINSSRSNSDGGKQAQFANRRYNNNRGNLRRGANNRAPRNIGYGARNGAGYARVAVGGVQKPQYFRAAAGLNNSWQTQYDASLFSNQRSGPAALLVTNLDFGVTESDIHDLFADFGPLQKAAVHYDRLGRSLGTADVVYERPADAIKAVKQYQGVPLDGRPMNIQFTTTQLPTPTAVGLSPRTYGHRPSAARGAGMRRYQQRGSARGAANNRRNRVEPTQEELDAELDAYVNKMQL